MIDFDETKLKGRLKKLYELAKRGEPGEKEAAQKALEKLSTKYSVDIDSLDDDKIEQHNFEIHGKEDVTLLVQVAAKVTEERNNVYHVENTRTGKRKRTLLAVMCTSAQSAEIEFLFQFYHNLYEQEKETLMLAFVYKHSLFNPKSLDNADGKSTMDYDKFRRITAMMRGLRSDTPNTPIERS